jgi:hypothetical protein
MQRTNQQRMSQSRNYFRQEDTSEVVNMRFYHNQLELEMVHKDNQKGQKTNGKLNGKKMMLIGEYFCIVFLACTYSNL